MYYGVDGLVIRPIMEQDLPILWSLIYKEEFPEWKKWDAPYFEHKQIPYGTKALRLWTNHLFNTLPLVRVGFTTWSGNERMICLGEKLGMTMEARLRKCRYYNGRYYDSIRMGLLREEWELNALFHS